VTSKARGIALDVHPYVGRGGAVIGHQLAGGAMVGKHAGANPGDPRQRPFHPIAAANVQHYA